MFIGNFIQYQTQNVGIDRLQLSDQVFNGIGRSFFSICDQNNTIGILGEQERVCHTGKWRTVQNNVVIVIGVLFQKI